ncbi:SDR family NAD(P)-dependent oxidoreductase [uncultured Cohaesibacter sp.]|uniref:SDR family NAD(P)-dependent oxidoreductase n=1 Tax=uncultured Cohaesibacter sp. TaxID=1002546 RepID=UPI0029302930|nr:SDR family NAD(P)-dependent oxidoreductase [uncultured Cohaesibacter sp.]
MVEHIAVFGGSGAIGGAMLAELQARYPKADICAVSRSGRLSFLLPDEQGVRHFPGLDLTCQESIEALCSKVLEKGFPDLVLVATGVLHGDGFAPERSLTALDQSSLEKVMAINFIGPSLLMKCFLSKVPRKGAFRMGLLSARVGSISDNRLGGWYAYRSSKAALNMMIKGAAIELRRRNPEAIVVGLHPGTVDSDLSKPFQANVPMEKLFDPAFSAKALIDVLLSRSHADSGRCYDWAGKEIDP